jgi:TonB family protein
MAPEQAEGKGVDHRCDVYSLGVVAYEMLTGRLPFTGDSPLAILLKHVSEPLPVPAPEQLPEPLLKAIQKAAAKDPSDRWASAGAFTRALESGLESTSVSLSAPGLNAGRLRIVIATAALLVVAATAWIAFTPSPSAPAQPSPAGVAQADVSSKPEAAPVAPPLPAPQLPPARVARPSPANGASIDDQVLVSASLSRGAPPPRDTIASALPEIAAEPAPATSMTNPTIDPPAAPGAADERPLPPAAGAAPPQSPSGEAVVPPRRTRTVSPTYPDVARAAEIEGDVVLQATVGADGAVSDIVVVRRVHPLLDAAAVAAVRQYEYTPGRRNGVPVAVRIRTTVSFKLR